MNKLLIECYDWILFEILDDPKKLLLFTHLFTESYLCEVKIFRRNDNGNTVRRDKGRKNNLNSSCWEICTRLKRKRDRIVGIELGWTYANLEFEPMNWDWLTQSTVHVSRQFLRPQIRAHHTRPLSLRFPLSSQCPLPLSIFPQLVLITRRLS